MSTHAKRTLQLLMAAMFLLGALCSTGAAQAAETATVLGSDVNLRSMPTTEANSLSKLSHGTEVTLLGQEGDWYKVEYGGVKGYIYSDCLFTSDAVGKRAYTTQDGVNLRQSPSESAYVADTIKAGRTVRINGISGDWYYVTYEDVVGYVKCSLVTVSKNLRAGDMILKFGMRGDEVRAMQRELYRRNFIAKDSYITGEFGSITRTAVQEFQKAAKMSVCDGIAGPDTLALLYDTSNGIKKVLGGKITASDVKGRVILIDWWKGGSSLLARPGGTATVTDVRSGKSFKIRRSGGNKHFDVHPLTAEDTAIFKSIVGSWTWNRRAIWLTIGSRVYAASMNCMPHSPDPSASDNFPGHFCIHLLNSRTHGSNSLDSAHQSCIRYAYEKGN